MTVSIYKSTSPVATILSAIAGFILPLVLLLQLGLVGLYTIEWGWSNPSVVNPTENSTVLLIVIAGIILQGILAVCGAIASIVVCGSKRKKLSFIMAISIFGLYYLTAVITFVTGFSSVRIQSLIFFNSGVNIFIGGIILIMLVIAYGGYIKSLKPNINQ